MDQVHFTVSFSVARLHDSCLNQSQMSRGSPECCSYKWLLRHYYHVDSNQLDLKVKSKGWSMIPSELTNALRFGFRPPLEVA